jgi:hypothetical protein
MFPYYALLGLCALQVWRPTVLVWCVLMAAFLYGLVIVSVGGPATIFDRVVFASLIGVPALALWLSRPRLTSDGELSR